MRPGVSRRAAAAALLLAFGGVFVYCKLRLVAGLPRTALAGEGPVAAAPEGEGPGPVASGEPAALMEP